MVFSADKGTLSLLFSNLATLLAALLFSWNPITVLWVYWGQSVSIGFFHALKLILMDSGGVVGRLGRFFQAGFFTVHYGIFHLVYAVFLLSFSAGASLQNAEAFEILAGIRPMFSWEVVLAALLFFLQNLFQFLSELPQLKRERDADSLMFRPYVRILPMHLTIIFGAVFLTTGQGHGFVLALFMGLKSAADLYMHLRERKRAEAMQGI